MSDKNKLLRRLWYSTGSPCQFSGIEPLYRCAKQEGPSIKKLDVKNWLMRQTLYTRTKQATSKFKRRRIVATIDSCWSVDLMDMSNLKTQNSFYTFILVCVDEFSRYTWCQPVKRKKPADIKKAFQNVFEDSKRTPVSVNMDNGLEFKNNLLSEYFKSLNIHMYFTTDPNIKSSIAERTIRSLKDILYKYCLSNNTWRYIDELQNIVEGFNKRKMHVLGGFSPYEIKPDNQSTLYAKMYSKKRKSYPYSFYVGESVRIPMKKNKFKKGYDPSFSSEIYNVSQRLVSEPHTYRLSSSTGHILNRTFYSKELVEIPNPDEQEKNDLRTIPKRKRRI